MILTESYRQARQNMSMTTEEAQVHILCNICGEDLGPERVDWGDEPLKKYPDHKDFRTSDITADQLDRYLLTGPS
jgi:hypothetical protein